MVKRKFIISIVVALSIIAFLIFALIVPKYAYHCDLCSQNFYDWNRHDVLIKETVDVTLCENCYQSYLLGELEI